MIPTIVSGGAADGNRVFRGATGTVIVGGMRSLPAPSPDPECGPAVPVEASFAFLESAIAGLVALALYAVTLAPGVT